MRWRTAAQHHAFARLTSYLADLPRYLDANTMVRDAFARYSGFSLTECRRVAALGERPLFQVDYISIHGQRVSANGSHRNGLITIDTVIANEVESGSSLAEGSARVLLYSVALHELVHFGRMTNRLSQTVHGNEAGKMFECTAYQGDIDWAPGEHRLRQRRSGVYDGVRWACPLSAIRPGHVRLAWTPN